jgi:hypothetical protein
MTGSCISMYDSDTMLQGIQSYGVSDMGIQSFWDMLAARYDKQWHTDNMIVEDET